MSTLLLLCSGLGLGNSTRLLGVAQVLRARGAGPGALRLLVGTNGAGLAFWERHAASVGAELLPLASYREHLRAPGGRLAWSSAARPAVARTYVENCRRIAAALDRRAADLALLDSDYHCPPLLARGVPIFALGQARDVVRRYRLRGHAVGVRARDMLVERLDALFQRLVAELVLVPCFEPRPGAEGKYRDVPLIVRREFEAPPTEPPAGAPPLVLLGGSSLGAERLLTLARERGLAVIGPGGEPSSLDERGRPRIDAASYVIAQAGLSSISECVARRRRMLLAPLPGHAEQAMNALEAARLGAGEPLGDAALAGTEPRGRGPERWPAVDGATVVARLLLERLGFAS